MYDPISLTLQAVSTGRPGAFALVFFAGVATSVGPCAAPRLIAISGLSTNADKSAARVRTSAFVGGLIAAYASFGIFASLLGRVSVLSHWIYIGLGLGLAAGAFLTLSKPSGKPSCGGDSRQYPSSVSPGAAFLLGGSFALVISPCCTPIVVAILAYCSQAQNALYGAVLLAVFAVGHAVPVIAVASGAALLMRIFQDRGIDEALRLVGGGLMLALSGYYLCLA